MAVPRPSRCRASARPAPAPDPEVSEVAQTVARTLSLLTLLGLSFGLAGVPVVGTDPLTGSLLWGSPAQTHPPRTVFLAGNLAPENLVTFTAHVVASGRSEVVLLDTPNATPYNKAF